MANFWLTYEGTRFPVRLGETVIGRSAYCTIAIGDASVSREHASMRLIEGTLTIADLGSRNGTYVNGERVTTAREVRAGDVVVLGTAAVQVLATEEDARARRRTAGLDERPARDSSEPPSTTTASTTTLDLIETVVERAIEIGHGDDFVRTLRAMIDNVVERGQSLPPADRLRVTVAARTMASWAPNAEVDAWCKAVSSRLGT